MHMLMFVQEYGWSFQSTVFVSVRPDFVCMPVYQLYCCCLQCLVMHT
jgi:hypothetical protein